MDGREKLLGEQTFPLSCDLSSNGGFTCTYSLFPHEPNRTWWHHPTESPLYSMYGLCWRGLWASIFQKSRLMLEYILCGGGKPMYACRHIHPNKRIILHSSSEHSIQVSSSWSRQLGQGQNSRSYWTIIVRLFVVHSWLQVGARATQTIRVWRTLEVDLPWIILAGQLLVSNGEHDP